jgi:hypothetical protein
MDGMFAKGFLAAPEMFGHGQVGSILAMSVRA